MSQFALSAARFLGKSGTLAASGGHVAPAGIANEVQRCSSLGLKQPVEA